MKTGSLGLKTYWDNPLKIVKTYVATGVTQHAKTQRWTYTVPAGRMFFMRTSAIMCQRVAGAATGTGKVQGTFEDGSNNIINFQVLIVVTNLTNAAGASGSLTSVIVPYLAGEVISAYTSDTFTTDTIDYFLNMAGVEVDI